MPWLCGSLELKSLKRVVSGILGIDCFLAGLSGTLGVGKYYKVADLLKSRRLCYVVVVVVFVVIRLCGHVSQLSEDYFTTAVPRP